MRDDRLRRYWHCRVGWGWVGLGFATFHLHIDTPGLLSKASHRFLPDDLALNILVMP
jgi:hypothetical protein